MAKRVKKYLVFMFGGWETVDKSREIIKNIRESINNLVSF